MSRYNNNESSVTDLLQFVNNIIDSSYFDPFVKKYKDQLRSIFINFVHTNITNHIYPSIETEQFELVHIAPNEQCFNIYFNIDATKELLRFNLLHIKTVKLFDVLPIINYTYYPFLHLIKTVPIAPVILIYKPSISKDNQLLKYEVIDGNHRISAAQNSNVNIDVCIIEEPFLPLEMFSTISDWKKFTILTALIIFGMQSINNMDDYLLKLSNYLLHVT